MGNSLYELFKKILNISVENDLLIDAFLSGSVSRKEERKNNNSLTSDIDIIIVFDDKHKLNIIKQSFFELNNFNNRKISFVFVYHKYFVKNLLADYALSINFSLPLVKRLPYIYPKVSEQSLDENRWVYQLQSCLYYFSKYKLTNSSINLCKSYLNSIKVEIYRYGLQQTNNYIMDKDIKMFSNNKKIENKMIYYSLCYNYLYNSLEIIPEKLIHSYLIDWYNNLFNQKNIDNICILNSNNYFMKNFMKNNKEVSIEHINKVIFENTGFVDKTLYQ